MPGMNRGVEARPSLEDFVWSAVSRNITDGLWENSDETGVVSKRATT